MKTTKAISVLLSLLLFCFYLPNNITVKAEEVLPWNGEIDTSWYDSQDTELYISTAEELAGLAQLVNEKKKDFANQTVYLQNDIDLNNKDWIPIGLTTSQKFAGTFDGQLHTIKGLYFKLWQDDENGGLFGVVEADIKNLIIDNCNIKISTISTIHSINAGVICGYMCNGSISNCKASGNIVASGKRSVSAGGICGYQISDSTIDSCVNNCIVEAYNSSYSLYGCAGGICGASYGTLNITNCYNSGDIKTSNPSIYGVAGGIIGHIELKSTIENTYNVGKIDSSNGGAIAGDIGKEVVVKNSYYLSSTANSGIGIGGTDTTISKSSNNMKKNDFSKALGNAFTYKDGLFPLLKWEIGEPITDNQTTTTSSTTTAKSTATSTTSTSTTTKLTTTSTTSTTTAKPTTTSTTSTTTTTKQTTTTTNNVVESKKIKELEDKISALERENAALKEEVEQLKNGLATNTFGDIDGNNMIDGRDASMLLTYYAKTSTGYTGTLKEYIESVKETES